MVWVLVTLCLHINIRKCVCVCICIYLSVYMIYLWVQFTYICKYDLDSDIRYTPVCVILSTSVCLYAHVNLFAVDAHLVTLWSEIYR